MQTIGDEQQQYTSAAEITARSVASHVRGSLIQIQQLAALGEGESAIGSVAETTLHLLDSYALLRPQQQLRLELEPVAMGAVVQDVMHQLGPFARESGCNLRDSYSGSSTLVLADRKLAKGALLAMAHAFIESASSDTNHQATVLFGIRRFGTGQKVGVFSDDASVSARQLAAGRKRTYDALAQCSGLVGSGRGLLLADSLLQQMNSRLQSSSYKRLSGVAALFQQNTQLSLLS